MYITMTSEIASFPFESSFIEIFGSKMHYIECGNKTDGPTLLFLHGTPSWSYLWRNIIPLLQESYHCVAVDMIGHGLSDCPDIDYDQVNQFKYLCEFIDTLKLKDLIIVGHSYGANMAIWYARTHSENTQAIAYLEPMLGSFKNWDDFNPYNENARAFFKNFRNPEINHDLLIKQNALISAFSQSALRPFTDEEMAAYAMPFLSIERRKVLWDGGPRNLPIENNPKPYCEIVEENLSWIKTGKVPQLFFYTEPAAFFTREQAENLTKQTNMMTGSFLGKGKYSHPEDYPKEIALSLNQWINNL